MSTIAIVLGPRTVAAHLGLQLGQVQIQATRDRRQVRLVQRFARQQQAERTVVIHDQASVAIEDAPARRRHRLRFHAVGQRPLVVELRILHLQPPEAGDQKHERGHGGVLKNGDLARRLPVIVAQRQLVEAFGTRNVDRSAAGSQHQGASGSSLSV